MKERPILFSAPMVRAILEGRKTQTRRAVRPQPYSPADIEGRWGWAAPKLKRGDALESMLKADLLAAMRDYCPHGQLGDQLWVRESLKADGDFMVYAADSARIDCGDIDWPAMIEKRKAVPSIHMPRWASRIQLEITGVRVERLQDISEADAKAEGAQFADFGKDKWGNQNPGWRADRTPTRHEESLGTARFAYASLWESINGSGSWDANPLVWVLEFKRVKP